MSTLHGYVYSRVRYELWWRTHRKNVLRGWDTGTSRGVLGFRMGCQGDGWDWMRERRDWVGLGLKNAGVIGRKWPMGS